MDILNTKSIESNRQIKIKLASQSTLSRFFNGMDETTLNQRRVRI